MKIKDKFFGYENFGVCIVLYKKSRAEVAAYIERASASQIRHFIYLNSCENNAEVDRPNIKVMSSDNIGLARPFNLALSFFSSCGVENVLILDDDTVILDWKQTAEVLFRAAQGCFEKEPRLAGLSCGNESPGKEGGKIWGFINSGLILNCQRSLAVGGFDESYFVEMVDYTFALRVYSGGYYVRRIGAKGYIDRYTGQAKLPPTIFGKPIFFLREYNEARKVEIKSSALRLLRDAASRFNIRIMTVSLFVLLSFYFFQSIRFFVKGQWLRK